MGAFLQLFKEFFLILTSGYIIFLFIIDYRKALIWYLLFYAFILLVGLSRVIYNENFLIPLLLLLVMIVKPTKITKPNVIYVMLFIYILLITYLNGLTITGTYSNGTYLFLILLIYSNHLFTNSDYAVKIIFVIWLITLAISLNFLIYGKDLLSVANIDSGSRDLILDTGIKESSASENGADLNYFSSGQAIGAMISIMLLVYRKKLPSYVSFSTLLSKIIYSNIFRVVLFLIAGLQIWFVFRGLSRGSLLVLFAGIITLLFLLKEKKYLMYGGISLIALFLFLNQFGIIDLFMERIQNDESGGTSGRNFIWLGMVESAYQKGGIIQIITGAGIDWPWWKFSTINTGYDDVTSSHNQWMSIFINFGLFGLILFIIPLVNGIRNGWKNKNLINDMRIVLFACFFAMSFSLEPLVFYHHTWFIVALAATSTPNLKRTGLNQNNN